MGLGNSPAATFSRICDSRRPTMSMVAAIRSTRRGRGGEVFFTGALQSASRYLGLERKWAVNSFGATAPNRFLCSCFLFASAAQCIAEAVERGDDRVLVSLHQLNRALDRASLDRILLVPRPPFALELLLGRIILQLASDLLHPAHEPLHLERVLLPLVDATVGSPLPALAPPRWLTRVVGAQRAPLRCRQGSLACGDLPDQLVQLACVAGLKRTATRKQSAIAEAGETDAPAQRAHDTRSCIGTTLAPAGVGASQYFAQADISWA